MSILFLYLKYDSNNYILQSLFSKKYLSSCPEIEKNRDNYKNRDNKLI